MTMLAHPKRPIIEMIILAHVRQVYFVKHTYEITGLIPFHGHRVLRLRAVVHEFRDDP